MRRHNCGRVRVVQCVDRFCQRPNGADFETVDNARLRRIRRGNEQPSNAAPSRRDGNGKYSANRVDSAVERELAEDNRVVDTSTLKLTVGGEKPERDREIEGGAGFTNVRRSELDSNAMSGKRESGVPDRRADT